jgi:Arm DNA-binding domain
MPTVASPRRLTARLIAGLRPNGRKRDISDTAVRELVLRIGPSGIKYQLFRFNWKLSERRTALGAFPEVSLAWARELASAKLRLLE